MAEKMMIEGELRVKEILRERGIKMYQLAEIIGITPESLTRALQRNPQFSTLKAIAEALNVPIRELFTNHKPESDFMKGTVVIGTNLFSIDSIGSLYDALECAKQEYQKRGLSYVEAGIDSAGE